MWILCKTFDANFIWTYVYMYGRHQEIFQGGSRLPDEIFSLFARQRQNWKFLQIFGIQDEIKDI